MIDTLSDLDAAALLAAAGDAVRDRRLAEVRDLELLSQWAAMHSSDPTEGPEGRRARVLGDVLVHLGGDGTPGVQDFCLGEIALARGTGVTATSNALADVLDLQHRLPHTWAMACAGEAEVFIARRVARLSRHLPADRVSVVDTAIARIIGHEAGGRVLAVAEAKIIEADPALHDERIQAERARRYVGRAAPTSSASAPSSRASRPATPSGSRRPSSVWPRSWRPRTLAPAPTSSVRSPSATSPARLSCCSSCSSTANRPSTSTTSPTGRQPSRPISSMPRAGPTSPASHPALSSTSTCTRPPSAVPVPSREPRGSDRSPSPRCAASSGARG